MNFDTTRQTLKKIFFWDAWFGKKKLFLKSRFCKKLCLQKISFWFKLLRQMHKFCVLRAIIKSTILKKNFFLKSMVLKDKVFVRSMILI